MMFSIKQHRLFRAARSYKGLGFVISDEQQTTRSVNCIDGEIDEEDQLLTPNYSTRDRFVNIEQRIRNILPSKGLSNIAELERACGISQGSIGKWGKGRYGPTGRNLEKLSTFLDVSVDFLLGNDDLEADDADVSYLPPVVEKILKLMESEGINGTFLTTELKLSNSSITEWKKGKAKPSVEAIVKIAKFFKVSMDYLLDDDVATGGIVKHKPTECDIVADRYSALDDDGRACVIAEIVHAEERMRARKPVQVAALRRKKSPDVERPPVTHEKFEKAYQSEYPEKI